ncbi:hypothetical protein PsYK624_168320 [Phanerochaete sordida]|uniref:BED-type domain-containing protein n=1 Tax=Phanerochaete sordida TaxID=48140 RepID=A0A9P3GSV0_9APHY|nr:hypothetical protein PsYK624_168320 [Phanerochaete sordida]
MSSHNNDLGCAVNVDGNLKDAADIEWQDSASKDDRKALTGSTSLSRPSQAADAVPSSPKGLPAAIVAGSCRVGGRNRLQTWKAARRNPLGNSNAIRDFLQPRAPPTQATAGEASTSTGPGACEVEVTIRDGSGDEALRVPKKPAHTKRTRVDSDDEDSGDKAPLVPKKRSKATSKRSKPKRSKSKGKGKAPATQDDDDDDLPELEGSDDEDKDDEDEGDLDDDDDEPLEFKRLRAAIEIERRPAKRPKTDATRDIRGIFKPAERTVDNKTSKGHWCSECRDCGDFAWFTGGVSSLRMHIRRYWKTHGKTYLSKCDDLGISPHPHAVPPSDTTAPNNSGAAQQTLDSFREPGPAKFTNDGLISHLVEIITDADLPIRIVNRGPFRAVLPYLQPSLKEANIPHHIKMREIILEHAHRVADLLREKYKDIPCKISLTFDAWTSNVSATNHTTLYTQLGTTLA